MAKKEKSEYNINFDAAMEMKTILIYTKKANL